MLSEEAIDKNLNLEESTPVPDVAITLKIAIEEMKNNDTIVPLLPPFPLSIIDQFTMGERWRDTDKRKKKELYFAFQPDVEEKKRWKQVGFAKLPHLLTFLRKEYGTLDNFDVVFYREQTPEQFYKANLGNVNIVFVNLSSYLSYGQEIDPKIRRLRVTKYAAKLKREYNKKIPVAFFNKELPSTLSLQLQKSNYAILEEILRDFENGEIDSENETGVSAKQEVTKLIEGSKIGMEIIGRYVKLEPESPKIQIKLLSKILNKMEPEDVEELTNLILNSKVYKFLLKNITKLSSGEQKKIAEKLPEMIKMHNGYEKLKKSLQGFEEKIQEHMDSKTQDEKDIHKYIVNHPWLLGIQYFGRKILSDIDESGNKTGKTTMGGGKRADFIIRRMDGDDICVVIELEEANDKIFRKNSTFSKKVYDGIMQAADYCIEQKMLGYHPKGMAVIGSLPIGKLLKEHKDRLRYLAEEFPNVEILTYDDIIERAKTTLKFFEKSEKEDFGI